MLVVRFTATSSSPALMRMVAVTVLLRPLIIDTVPSRKSVTKMVQAPSCAWPPAAAANPRADGNKRAGRPEPRRQYKRLTHAHAAATGVTRHGAPASNLSRSLERSKGKRARPVARHHNCAPSAPPAAATTGQRPQPPPAAVGDPLLPPPAPALQRGEKPNPKASHTPHPCDTKPDPT